MSEISDERLREMIRRTDAQINGANFNGMPSMADEPREVGEALRELLTRRDAEAREGLTEHQLNGLIRGLNMADEYCGATQAWDSQRHIREAVAALARLYFSQSPPAPDAKGEK